MYVKYRLLNSFYFFLLSRCNTLTILVSSSKNLKKMKMKNKNVLENSINFFLTQHTMHTNYCIILLGWNNSSFHLIIQKTKMGSSCKQDFYKPFYTIIMLSIIYLQLLEGFDNLIFKCWGFFFLNTARLKNTCINNQMAVLIWYCLTINKPSLHYRKWYLVNGHGSDCPIFLF